MRRFFSNEIRDAVDNYYYHNPDTLMPLLMLALAAKGKLSISVGTNKPDAFACVLSPIEIINYDWFSNNGKYVYHIVHIASIISAVKCVDVLTNTIILIENTSIDTYTYNKCC